MNLASDQEVAEAIEGFQQRLRGEVDALGKLIDARVRYEQRRDQLTKLSNDVALQEALLALIDGPGIFWVAFVEVDKFKRVNDLFGYQSADLLLQSIADTLRRHTVCFPGGAAAFRAHGDEFYLAGAVASELALASVESELDRVREAIGALRVSVIPPATHEMKCTVSVGWITSRDVAPPPEQREPLTPRGVIVGAERAVGAAKQQGRNRVVRFLAAHADDPPESERGDCPICHCKFSFDVPRAANQRTEAFHCPNCGNRVLREAPLPADDEGPGAIRIDESAAGEVPAESIAAVRRE